MVLCIAFCMEKSKGNIMERPYESGMNDTAIFFTGIEVEKTHAHNICLLYTSDAADE